ncbi:putative pyrroloquinoline-quinone binding quinoprotein [Rhodococcus rhodochrous J38]|uniref:outer membrane protein assembly factor BamB family protein n=1 Tax=Rhodococcus rhodochrous TaxID=1829 RepID=UPI0011A5F002|nr:PQQ-binding-like beta-propeller repeat protein [Rhodococcus rhodochrous]TWH52638.1 putative pyrroloquinoline-quinone binding quinoprotein [Rhodococcus rhodochrous J38]
MGFDKQKAIIAGGAAVAAVAVVAGTAIALSGGSTAPLTGDPAPGTYSQAPREVGTHELEFKDEQIDPLLTTDNTLVYYEDVPTGPNGTSSGKRLTGLDLETGSAWEYMMKGFAYCGSSEMYADDASVIMCVESDSDTMTLLDPKDGSIVATPPQLHGNYYIAGNTVYTCGRENGTFKLWSSTGPEFTENLLATVPADTKYPCTLSRHGDHIAIESAKNWVTVLHNDGTIVYQDFDVRGTLNSAGLLETTVQDEDVLLADKTFDVLDLDGTKVYEYSEPVEEVLSIPGGRDSGLFIDEYGAVRERATGTVRWTYSAPDYFDVVGLTGDMLVMVEEGTRMRAYNAEDGTPMWAISTDNVFPRSKSGSLPGDPGDFSPSESLHRVAGDGETLLFAAGTRLTAVDVASGAIMWDMGTGGWFLDEYQDYIVLSDNERLRILHFG